MKKIIIFELMSMFLFSQGYLLAQNANIVMPWIGMQEYVYFDLPVGGWNVLGTFSPRSTAMGETLFSAGDASAGYLNPAFLASIKHPVLSTSYRYCENTYNSSAGYPYINLFDSNEWTQSFERSADYIDTAGVVLPYGNWALAVNYSVLQDFSIPDIRGLPYFSPSKVKQSGSLKGLNFALSSHVTSSFSLGFSYSYLYGEISRFQVTHPVYWPLIQRGFERGLPLYPDTLTMEDYSLDLKGFLFNLGCTVKLSRNCLLGVSIRPPFKLNLKTKAVYSFPDIKRANKTIEDDYYLKFPFVATVSLLYRPLTFVKVTADVSYWGWSNAGTDLRLNWYYPRQFRNILRMNLGIEYRIELPFRFFDSLAFRGGYIYDPQPYSLQESFARNFISTGFGLAVWNIDIDAAVKIALNPVEANRFNSNLLQVGISYRF